MSKEEVYRDILVQVLDCGYLDISVIEDCKYDFSEIIEEMKMNGFEINLNSLAYEMFHFGKRDISDWVEDRIAELKSTMSDEDVSEEKLEEIENEIESLESLEPLDDIESFHNYIDTSVYFSDSDKESIYRKYCQEALDEFEENTGFSIG